MNAVLLISGNLGLHCLKQFPKDWEIAMVFTDKRSASIIEFSKANNIKVFSGNPRGGKAKEIIASFRPDVVFSINYLFLVEKDIFEWPLKYCFNIHGSLLPKYRGRTPHVWAIINGEESAGATVHIVDEGCDTGPVVLQKSFMIGKYDTGATVLAKFNDLYPGMIKEVLEAVKREEIQPVNQDHSKATVFGVRTPDSGMINWSWPKEKIRNWVRAQAKPYPMAFTYNDGQKLWVNKVELAEHEFDGNDPDGLVLSLHDNMPVIKVPDGAVIIMEFEGGLPKQGSVLK